MDHGGDHPEREGEVMSQVQGGRDHLWDNLPTIGPLTGQTGNLNQTSALCQKLPLLQKRESGEEGLLQDQLNNTGRSRAEEEEKEGDAAANEEDEEEEDLDAVMKEDDGEEEDDVSEGSIICCQSPDTPMTDSSYSETASLLETPYPLSPGTSPEPTSPLIPTAPPETLYPIDAAPSSGTGSAPVGRGPASWAADPRTLTSDPPSPPDRTRATEHATSSAPSPGGPLTSAAAPGPPPPLRVDSPTARTPRCPSRGPVSSTQEPPPPPAAPAGVSGPRCEVGPAPGRDLLDALEDLSQRGDDPLLPLYLHQIAEAFVLKENYQWALWCVQLERLYHQRVLDNLNVLQEQWERQSKPTSSELAAQHLDRLKHICQTHSRPRATDAVRASLDWLRSAAEEGGEVSPRVSDAQADGRMEPRDGDSSPSHSSRPLVPSSETTDVESPDIAQMEREDPEREPVGGEGFHRSQLSDGGGGEPGEEVGRTTSGPRDELHPPTSAALEQAEPPGGDLCLTRERQAREEAGGSGEDSTALAMDVEGEEEEEEEEEEVEKPGWSALQAESVAGGTEVERQLAGAEQSQQSSEGLAEREARLPPDDHTQPEQGEEDEEEDDLEDADVTREASSLDDLAKLITVEEMSPVSGLVSILKRRGDPPGAPAAPPDASAPKAPTKRRVRFKFPDDSYEHDVGGGDSCLLLFLLCLVTVVISLGGTALYCALGDVQSSVCQDFSRNADFYVSQIQRGISHLQHWFGPAS